MSVYHAPLACAPVNLAMRRATICLYWARAHAFWADIARRSTGSKRCSAAAYAGDAKRRARHYAALHNDAIAAIR